MRGLKVIAMLMLYPLAAAIIVLGLIYFNIGAF
jgi:hypothetical protein